MHAWSGEGRDIMGPTVNRTGSGKATTPPLKNGNDLRESGYLIAVGSRTARFRRKHKNKVMLITFFFLLLLLLCLAIVMTVLYVRIKRYKNVKICESTECLRSAANLALSIDYNADPCEDFYQYSCGNWGKDHPRPDTYTSYDWFRDKQSKVYSIVRDFLTKNISGLPKPVCQAKEIYTACMDTETLDKLGLKPVLQVLESFNLPPFPTIINATEDFDYETYSFDWIETVIKIKTQLGMDVLIGFDIFPDPKNSSVYKLAMGSPEISNPFPSMHTEKKRHNGKNKKYFVPPIDGKEFDETFYSYNDKKSKTKNDDDDAEKIDKIFKILYAEMMKIFVIESGHLKSANVNEAELDLKLLNVSSEYYSMHIDLNQLESDNNTDTDFNSFMSLPQYSVYELQAHTDMTVESNNGSAVPIWQRYLEGIFNTSNVVLDYENDKILVTKPDLKYLSLMAAFINKTPPAKIELYIWIKVVEVMAAHTSSELRQLVQRWQEETSAQAAPPPRSLQCASAANDLMGMAVSYAIAEPQFLNVTKPKVQTMLYEMKNALAHLVGKAKWMDDDTKLATYQKIIQMKTLIGFPDWFLDDNRLEEYYEGIEVKLDTHLQNMINVIQLMWRKGMNRFREGNSYTWATYPTEVNAYHTFHDNTITVPLVMLQHPFFDLGLDSLNYGSLGTVLGHEITHGFDNFGRQFDKNGNLLPWWTNETVEAFVNLTQCFVDQYSTFYLPEIKEHVDGKKTLGENIADNGGVREALAALKHHLQKYGPEPKLPGFEDMTSEQMFFLSYGNLWCSVATTEALRADIEDEHTPTHLRAKGALQNNEEFARAWGCASGSTMNPRTRCIIF